MRHLSCDLHAASLEALADVHDSTQRELKFEAKDMDGLIVQRKKLNQLHSRQEQLLQDIAKAQSDLQAAGEPQTTYEPDTNPFAAIDLSVPNSQDNPYPALADQITDLQQSLANLAEVSDAQTLEYRSQLASLNTAWQQADALFPPSDGQQQAFESGYRTTSAFLQSWEQFLQIPWDALAHPAHAHPARRPVVA